MLPVGPTRYRDVVLTSWDRRVSDCEQDPPATEAVKKLLDQNITQVTEIRRLGRGQLIGSRCDKFNAPPPQVQRRINRSMQLMAEARVTRIGPGIQS